MEKTYSEFVALVQRPLSASDVDRWAFVVLPQAASAKLPRRGRTTISGKINGYAFQALLEPDGQKSHWLKLDEALLEASGARVDEEASFEIASLASEPEPQVPDDLSHALDSAPDARVTWEQTTTLARVDWIHWITSAKQSKTREKRVNDACEMLASGKKKVCCFDPSGFYSKAFSAPESAQ